jgi:hypothetical protein
MADRPLFTKESAIAGQTAVSVSIVNTLVPTPADAHVRLFDDSFVPDVDTTRTELVAAETTLVGYPVGGYVIDAFAAPVKAPLGGVVATSNLVNVAYASGAQVVIGGYWLEDATAVTPKVREVFIYDPPRTLSVLGDGWPIVVQLGYGA